MTVKPEYVLGTLKIYVNEKEYPVLNSNIGKDGEDLFISIDYFEDKSVPFEVNRQLAIDLGNPLFDSLESAGFKCRKTKFDFMTEEDIICIKTESPERMALAKIILAGHVAIMQRERFPRAQEALSRK